MISRFDGEREGEREGEKEMPSANEQIQSFQLRPRVDKWFWFFLLYTPIYSIQLVFLNYLRLEDYQIFYFMQAGIVYLGLLVPSR